MEAGIYIHIPFCRSKCPYCDFYSGGARIADWQRYAKALIEEIKSRRCEISSPSTLYIGGGTPSLVPPDILISCISEINKIVENTQWREFTLEVNPEDVTDEICEAWKEIGVNRISLGVQSLSDIELKAIRRRHDAKTTINNYNTLKKYFSNISVDLMFGLPTQTLKSYQHSLDAIIDMAPQHISSYSLMLEEGTAMTIFAKTGKLKLPDESEWLKMFDLTFTKLTQAGYNRYEISNFAIPGFESIHNSGYWKNRPYLGLGPGAHSYDGINIRRMNPCDLKGYINSFAGNKCNPQFYKEEVLSKNELREEMLLTRLRLSEGLNINEYESLFGNKETISLLSKTAKWIKDGDVMLDNEYLKMTSKGVPMSNTIISDLF